MKTPGAFVRGFSDCAGGSAWLCATNRLDKAWTPRVLLLTGLFNEKVECPVNALGTLNVRSEKISLCLAVARLEVASTQPKMFFDKPPDRDHSV
jgi:hypothetical protein